MRAFQITDEMVQEAGDAMLCTLDAAYERGETADWKLLALAALTVAQDLAPLVEYDYGSAVRDADGTVWDHEQHELWSDAELAKANGEPWGDGEHVDDGSRVVRIRRIREGDWEIIPADRPEESR